LRGADGGVEIPDQLPGDLRAAMPFEHQGVELSVTDFYHRQFRRDKETVQQDKRANREQFEQDGTDGFAGHVVLNHRLTSPKMNFRMSCRLTMPTSRWLRPSTMASRWPLRCIRRNASSTRISSFR